MTSFELPYPPAVDPSNPREPVTLIKFELPYPPSTNKAYFTDKRNGRRVLTSAARKYKAEVVTYLTQEGIAEELKELCKNSLTLTVKYELIKPTWFTIAGAVHTRAGDTDNLKVLKDAIFQAIGKDDAIEFTSVTDKVVGPDKRVSVLVKNRTV